MDDSYWGYGDACALCGRLHNLNNEAGNCPGNFPVLGVAMPRFFLGTIALKPLRA
jgi:hypothetical protein